MIDAPLSPPGHWVQCPECLRYFENEQGRGSHRLHAHGIRSTGEPWLPAPAKQSTPSPTAPAPVSPTPPATPPAPRQAEPASPQDTLPPPGTPAATPAPPASQTPNRTAQATLDTLPPSAHVDQTVGSIDWSDPKNLPTGLNVVAQSLAHTRPGPNMGNFGKAVVGLIVLALSAFALYLVVQQLKGANAPPSQPYIIDAARIQPGAPNLTTGDPYWDSILGYRGRRL